MATGKSGVLTLSGTDVTAQITWNETYEISSNTSIITITNLDIKTSTGSYFLNGSLAVDGTDVVTFSSYEGSHSINVLNSYEYWPVQDSNGNTSFKWKSKSITHNNDGSKKVSISLNVKTYEYPSGWLAWSINTSGNISLTTIPRASSLSLSVSSVNVGGPITATITSASSSFTHTVEFYINNSYHQEFTKIATSKTFTIPDSWYNYMSSSTSCTAYCRITTYNGSTQIGNTVSKSFTVNVPSNIVPTCGSLILNPTDINNNNILVKGKNALGLSVSGCKAGAGSSIKSYTFSGPSFSKTISTSSTSSSTSISSVSSVGTLTYKVVVTDARGRSSSSTKTIACYDYYSPYFTKFNVYRANSDGSENPNGSYLKYTYSVKYASVNSTNSVNITAYYNNNSVAASGGSGLINLNGDTSTTYKVYLKITDSYGGSGASLTVSVFGQTRIFNVTSDGTGFAIGKMAESKNLFECRWDAKFDGAASGPSGFSTSSDRRVKKNIEDINIDIVDSLHPIQYKLIQDKNDKIHYGFIAQDIEKLWSNAGLDPNSFGIIGQINNGGTQEYVLTYTEFIPLLTKKCQCLQNEIDELKLEIETLKNNIK